MGNFQSYRSRGVNIRLARNYFISGSIPRDTFNLERIEQSRGPNSVLFGIGSAGGVASLSTKSGIIGRSFQKVLLSTGSHNSWRAAIDLNQSLAKNAAICGRAAALRGDRCVPDGDWLAAGHDRDRREPALHSQSRRRGRPPGGADRAGGHDG